MRIFKTDKKPDIIYQLLELLTKTSDNMLYDTHCHPNLAKQKNGEDIIKAFHLQNPEGFLNMIGTQLDTSQRVIELSNKYHFAFCSIGIHPNDAIMYRNERDATIKRLEQLYIDNKNRVVAVGECGLDYYWLPSLEEKFHLTTDEIKEIQKDFFIKQIMFAEKYGLPFIIHNRGSRDDVLEIVRNIGYKNFILHCYGEDFEYAQKLIEFSPECKIGFSGILTFTNAKGVQETAKNIPLKNILVETDSPYLTPSPLRGKEENEPMFCSYVLDSIISLREENPEMIKKQIFENSKRVFGIEKRL